MLETILRALADGAMTLTALIEATRLPARDLLAVLRAQADAGKVEASRWRRGRSSVGPVYWRLAGTPEPRQRARPAPPPAATVLLLLPTGGYEDQPPHSNQAVVERLAGTTTFRMPSSGFGGKPATTLDEIDFELAHAEGTRLQRALAYAVATRDARLWPEVLDLAYPHMLQVAARSPMHRPLVAGRRCIRLRFVLWHAFQDLVGMRTGPKQRRARETRMQLQAYIRLYDLTARELQAEADEVIYNAVTALRA